MSAPLKKILEMRGVKLQFQDKVVLKNIDLSIESQETLVIMGLSGCGKSTLLSIVLGLLKPDAGSVFFKQEDLTLVSRQKFNQARMRIGMVYQNAALLSSLNVGENVALPLQELSHKNPREIDSIIDEKLELVGLKDVKNKFPSELSGGMQRRVGMARALALDPELLLFDEPTAGLDPITSELINELIVTLRDKQKVTSIIVTHEMDSAFALATRMVFLNEGMMIFDGTPTAMKESKIPIIREFLSSYSTHKK